MCACAWRVQGTATQYTPRSALHGWEYAALCGPHHSLSNSALPAKYEPEFDLKRSQFEPVLVMLLGGPKFELELLVTMGIVASTTPPSAAIA